MNTSYDKFIRTTDADHERQVQKIFKKLYDQGDIYKGEYVGKYCTPCESFFTDSQMCRAVLHDRTVRTYYSIKEIRKKRHNFI